MAQVTIEGVFMGASIKKSSFDGKESTSLYIDVYQPASEGNVKMLQIKTDDVGLYQVLTDNYSMGTVITANATVNAYQNKAYFKLVNLVEES